ncbi:hypothetical protein DdX_18781 [Ditylenchus destructor]|uniref:Uncharacterized protein n=1 Tax=Ditylenchus destructor TaxID=166010 RepID=A0AAD4MLN8_9BILA|nr:hypothetical protein DdX_18781 [Ditylenchus destructor]
MKSDAITIAPLVIFCFIVRQALGTFLLRYSVAFLEAQSRSRFGSPHLIRSAAFARAQSNLGTMNGKVTLQRKGSGPVKGQSITLYGNGESDNVTFDATFPECDFSNAFKRVGWDYKEEVEDRFAFRYDSTEKDCVLFLWWNKTDRGIKQLRQTDEWKIDSDSIVSAENSDNKQFVFKNGRMSLGYPRAPVCAPSFEDGALLFTVEIPPKYCNATLVFVSYFIECFIV